MIVLQLALAAAIAAAGFGSAWIYQGAKYDSRIATLSAEHSLAQAAAATRALAETTRLQHAVDEAERLAARRLTSMARDVARTRHVADGLRSDLSAARSAVPGASCSSLREHATTLSDVFGECATRLVEVAAIADGHAIDTLKLTTAWPTGRN